MPTVARQVCHNKCGFIAVCTSYNCGVLLKVLSLISLLNPHHFFVIWGRVPKWRKRDKSFRGGVWGETLFQKGSFRGGVWGETLFQKGPPQLRGVHTAASSYLSIISSIAGFGIAPTFCAVILPFFITTSIGMLDTPKCAASSP